MFKGKKLAGIIVSLVILTVASGLFSTSGSNENASINENTSIPWYDSLEKYASEHGKTVAELTAKWDAEDWWDWFKYEGNPIWGSTNITDDFLATNYIHLSNIGNLTWGANYDIQAKFNSTSGKLDWIGQSNNFSAWNLKLPASYIIWKDGNTVYATNGTTGLVDYSGTDVSTVIQSVVNTIPSGVTSGGIIVFQKDTYTINSKITIDNRNVIFDFMRSILDISSLNDTAFEFTGLTARRCILRNALVKGDTTLTSQVFAKLYNKYGRIENIEGYYGYKPYCFVYLLGSCYIFEICNNNFAGSKIPIKIEKYVDVSTYKPNGVFIINNDLSGDDYGIYVKDGEGINIIANWIEGASTGIYIEDALRILVADNTITDCTTYGINITGASSFPSIVNNRFVCKAGTSCIKTNIYYGGSIVNNKIYNNDGDNVKFIDADHVTQCVVSNNIFRTEYSGSSIYFIYAIDTSGINNLWMINNNIISSSVSLTCDAIYMTGTYRTKIFLNAIQSFGGISISGAYNEVKYNYGYKTENSDTAEITGDGTNTTFYISHSLATTPTWVGITPTNFSMANTTWFWNVSATNSSVFAITFSTAPASGDKLSFAWEARVD